MKEQTTINSLGASDKLEFTNTIKMLLESGMTFTQLANMLEINRTILRNYLSAMDYYVVSTLTSRSQRNRKKARRGELLETLRTLTHFTQVMQQAKAKSIRRTARIVLGFCPRRLYTPNIWI